MSHLHQGICATVNRYECQLIVFDTHSTENILTFNVGESVIHDQPVGKLVCLHVDNLPGCNVICPKS